MSTPAFRQALAQIRHFLAIFEGDLPKGAERLHEWLDPWGFWHQPERHPAAVDTTAHELVGLLDTLRRNYLDNLPNFMTRAQYQRIGPDFRAADGQPPRELRQVGGYGTCLMPVILIDGEFPTITRAEAIRIVQADVRELARVLNQQAEVLSTDYLLGTFRMACPTPEEFFTMVADLPQAAQRREKILERARACVEFNLTWDDLGVGA